ncbi:alpha/beta hydrolase [Piscinibacter sp. XHJ-5]|uniref:alpha/beta fold hydrolase n=1 Tax=Piscinibacter sp. XHJ-5 TaxID=3037797 RepID=UPI0024531FC4|nr:alpha/beta hydrolase [Piscinibacter sp. XHJ-5]
MSTTTWVNVDGAVLAAEVEASHGAQGVPLVFLHAGVCDRRMWQAQWEAFAASHPLLRYDRRGFGETRTLAPTRHSREADLWAVMDAARFDSAVLVGCSQGGRVAIDAALAQPQRVRALVLVAPAVGGAPQAELTGRVQRLAGDIDAASARRDVDAVNELEAQLWLDGPAAPPGRVGGATRELFLAMNGIALRADDVGEALEPAATAWRRLQELQVPTLVLWGDLDLPHLRARCEELVRRISGAQRVMLEGAAHLPSMDAPEAFNAALRRFIGRLPLRQ